MLSGFPRAPLLTVALGQISEKWGAEVPFLRPDSISGDQTPVGAVVDHCVEWMHEHEGQRPGQVCLPLASLSELDKLARPW